ncbi:hypothetical protein [Polaribacter sp. IC063]|uniref:hypothetical protein n=1 Tax=Polaribacter sp. IC063 TaxID=57031 RepID=UPI0011BF5349|nr:hypothetical protein [Polaribacter sp. IC063]TXD53910.1 hypothetical protein ES043_02465 [Polaribacter sp. IC063]
MKDILINNDLLEEIRISRNTRKWEYAKVDRIVDIGYTHEYLLANRRVDDVIKESYIKSIKEIYRVEEWERFTDVEKNDITKNCSLLIEGALHNRINLWVKIGTLLEYKEEQNLNNKYNYFLDLKPYFKSYANSFASGYNTFLDVVVKPYSLFENNKEEASLIIFKFITNAQSKKLFVSSYKGLKFSCKNGEHEIECDISDGLNEGFLYKAWAIIFIESELFLPLFQNYLNDNKRDIKDNLKINQIALKYFYEKRVVTRENCNSEIVKFGHTSGEKLYQKFTYYSSRANRKGIPSNCTAKKLQNKIKLIESVIRILPDDCKKQAIDEVGILKIIAEEKNY